MTYQLKQIIMRKITKEKFLKDVRTEVESLKRHATSDEIDKLDLGSFDPDGKFSCIYGQMTGSCESERAKLLMDKSCVRVTKQRVSVKYDSSFASVSEFINGKYTGQTWGDKWTDKRYNRNYAHLSMVETYIFLKGASPENIINYLKGRVDVLELPLD